MARKANKKRIGKLTKDVQREVTAATTGALGKASALDLDTDPEAKIHEILRLVTLCEEAADHLGQAHNRLFEDDNSGEVAIEHLDSAIALLKQVGTDEDSDGEVSAPARKSA